MAVVLQVIQPAAIADACDCTFSRCRFRLPLVRFYLYAYRQAQIAREPFADVLRDCVRNSREVDPFIRAGRIIDRDACHEIALSLEMARDQGAIALTPWNAERIAAYLCPGRWDETR